MKYLQTGNFFGETTRTIYLDGITLTDTRYTHQNVDWHFHENAYFTFLLQGRLIEGNKKETLHCSAGSLLFHSWQEPHYNYKPVDDTRGFHIEFQNRWFDDLALDISALQGSFSIENPDIKFLLYNVFRETRLFDNVAPPAIQMLLLEIFGKMLWGSRRARNKKPCWVKRLQEIVHDGYAEKLSLKRLSDELQIHPAHLSRDFSKYFSCTFGEYIRKVRVEKSLALLPNKNLSLTEIALACGFADQSHFLRCFKKINGIKPSAYRKLLLS